MIAWRRGLLGAVAALTVSATLAEPLPRSTPHAAYLEVARTGELRHVQIDGDLDLARMRPPAGATRIVMDGVQLEGKLYSTAGGPAVALWIDKSTMRDLDLRGTRWGAALAIENSTVKDRAWFDGAQFAGAFALHACTFTGQTVFRGTRFAAPVEIVYSQFLARQGLRGGVSFTDARFAAPARFDRSRFGADVRFDTSRFDADASFLGLMVDGRASWRNVMFGGDAEFRFCRLGDVDFGDAEQMSLFNRLADFRGCTMRSASLDYADIRGDALLVNVRVAPGDLTLRHAGLRGNRSDFSGLNVAGRLVLEGAQITNLHMQWHEISPALLRSAPRSDVLRPVQRRLEELKRDDEAREAAAVLAGQLIHERLAQPDTSSADKVLLWAERIVWGLTTGYGTRLGRIVGLALTCWVLLSLPIVLTRHVRIGRLRAPQEHIPASHRPMAPDALHEQPLSRGARILQGLEYGFGLMFAIPNLRLRPAEPLTAPVQAYLLFMRGAGVVLLALMALTLTRVSPVIQAVLGKIVS